MILEFLFILFFCIGDFYTTKIGLESGKCREANPLCNNLNNNPDFYKFAIYKVLVTLFILLSMYILSHMFTTSISYLSKIFFIILVITSIFVVIWNIIIIYKSR
jgi:hypothetical protein